MNKIWNAVIFMTLNFHKKPQRDFVFHFFFNFYYSLIILFFFSFFFFFSARRCARNCVLAYRELRVWMVYMYVLPKLIKYMYPITLKNANVWWIHDIDKDMYPVTLKNVNVWWIHNLNKDMYLVTFKNVMSDEYMTLINTLYM